jgi:thiosulfate reductase/polysulfide reductase chain A
MVSSNEAQARLFRVLSLLLRDEVRLQDLDHLLGKAVPESVGAATQHLAKALGQSDAKSLHKELCYEYADLFLNAGVNPAFPYESVHVTGQPVVMQEPVFALREKLAGFGVHKNPEYKDLDEHIAVELELAAYLFANGKEDEASAFVRDHLKEWGTAFAGQLQFCAQSDFYKGLALLLQAALETPVSTAVAIYETFEDIDPGPGLFTLAQGAVEPGPEQDIPTHCYTCGALCGMNAKVKDGVFVKAAGLKGDPKGAGRLCPKGAATPKHVYSAYRLKAPMIKEDGRFRKATWEEALDKTAQGIKSIPQGKLVYFRGNDFVNWIHEGLFDHLGCPKGTHRTMCDNSNRMATEHILNDKRPWINYQESDYILHFGMNELSTSYGQRKRAELKSARRQILGQRRGVCGQGPWSCLRFGP